MKVDWQKAESEYITTNISYRALAKKLKVSAYAVQEQGKKRQWTKKRKDFKSETYAKAIQKSEEIRIEKTVELTDKLIETIRQMIVDAQESYQKARTSREKRIFVQNIKDLVPTLHLLTGKPTEIQKDADSDASSWQEFIAPLIEEEDEQCKN